MEEFEIPSSIGIPAVDHKVVTAADQALVYARQIAVTDQSTYELAAIEASSLKARRDAIELQRVELKAPLLEATRRLDGFFKRALDPLDQAIGIVKTTMLSYRSMIEERAAEERRKAEEAARKARQEAERKAVEERAKAEAEARRKREEAARAQAEAEAAFKRVQAAKDAEARAKAEKERKAAEEVQRKAEAAAARAIENGETKATTALQKGMEAAAAPAVITETPSAKGTATRMKRTAIVRDLKLLVDAVSAGKAPLTSIVADQKVLNKAAEALGAELPKFYPGVELHEQPILAIGTKSG